MKTKFISISITIIISFLLGYLSIYQFESYGWTIFLFLPVLVGFIPSYFLTKKRQVRKSEAIRSGFLTLGLALLLLTALALEGLICIAMAAPLLAALTYLGARLGITLATKNPKVTGTGILILAVGFLSFDKANHNPTLIPVTTSVEIDAPIEKVWNNIITFDSIAEPDEWIFKTGISYPTHATIDGKGVGAIRYCNFTTGSFVEPITTWNEPNLLQFDVIEQPTPMNEYNPLWDIHPPHLDGYFASQKGQFKLEKINDSKTKLIGTTWYYVDIQPEFYWSLWSDYIIHKIHLRALNHIKHKSE